jgi:hypothetical protein
MKELLRGFLWKRSRTFRDGAPVATLRFPNTLKCCVLKLKKKKGIKKERSVDELWNLSTPKYFKVLVQIICDTSF